MNGVFPNNEKIIKVLETLRDLNSFLKERFKVQAYQRAIYTIKQLIYDIRNIEDTSDLQGIGKGIRHKIELILTNRDPLDLEYHNLHKDPDVQAYFKLKRVPGLGISKIRKLIAKGIFSVPDLRKAERSGKVLLTHQQHIGLKYLKDLTQYINRSEITKFKKRIESVLKYIYRHSKINAKFDIVGSYRRCHQRSGDIDILIYTNNNDPKIPSVLLNLLIDELEKRNIIIERITNGKVTTKFMGIVRTTKKGKARHIDIRSFTKRQYPFALLYFTGSRSNNIRMRTNANREGYKLNEYELLYKRTGKPVQGIKTERDIFKKIGMTYKNPEDR